MFFDILDFNKLTCYQLSKKSGVSYTAINELYRGERSIEECSVSLAKKIAQILEVSIDKLINDSLSRPSIPQNLYKCFWDTDPNQLDLIRDKTYIIPRLLDKGGFEGFRFLQSAYYYEEIKEVAKISRNFSPKIAYFLKNVYHLKEEEMTYFKRHITDWRI